PSTRAISTLSLHDALPISRAREGDQSEHVDQGTARGESAVGTSLCRHDAAERAAHAANPSQGDVRDQCGFGSISRTGDVFAAAQDRKSTRLNSSHVSISYA